MEKYWKKSLLKAYLMANAKNMNVATPSQEFQRLGDQKVVENCVKNHFSSDTLEKNRFSICKHFDRRQTHPEWEWILENPQHHVPNDKTMT